MHRLETFVTSLALLCLAPFCLTAAEPIIVNHPLEPPLPPPDARAVLRAVPIDAGPGRQAIESGCALLRQADACRAFGTLTPAQPGSYRLELDIIHTDGRRTLTTLGRKEYSRDATFDVVLLLDSSESMKKTDPRGLRLDAVRTFLALARQSGTVRRIALVSFREETEVILPFCAPGDVRNLEARLAKLRPAKATNMDAAFRTAAELLRNEARPAGVRPAVIFLSDGKPSVLRKYENGHTELHAYNCPAYTVALSERADAELLRRMATETGGRFMKAVDARELESIFTGLFGIIAQPRTVHEDSIVSADREQFRLLLDPSMRGAILACASLDAAFDVETEGKNPVTVPSGDLRFLSLHDLAPGSHTVGIRGKGRMALRLTASTPLHLDLMPLNRNAPRGLPILCYAYLPDLASANPEQVSAVVYGPDHKPRAATVLPDPSLPGLFAARCGATDAAGSYRLVVRASGAVAGMPFARQRIAAFERIGEAVAEFGSAAPVSRAMPDALERIRRTFRLQPETPVMAPPQAALRTTLQCTPSQVVFDGLWPGDSAQQEIRIRFHGEDITRPTATLEPPVRPDGVLVTLDGKLEPRGESVLAIRVAASPNSAARSWARALRITSARGSWQIPVRGSVAAPRIVATLSDTRLAYNEETQQLRAGTTLQIHIEPRGRCLLLVATQVDRGELSAARPEVVAGQEPVTVDLELCDVRRKDQDSQWLGQVTVSGAGMAAAVLPYRLAVPAHAAVPAPPAQAAALQLDPRLLRLALFALAALLAVLLLVAILRKQRRMVFICASSLVHLAALFLVLPVPAEPAARDAGGPPAVFPEAALIAHRVSPERSEEPTVTTSEAEAVTQTPPAAPRPDEVADTSRRVTPETLAAEAAAQPRPRDAATELQRTAAETRELADPVAAVEARRAAQEQAARRAELANAIEAMTPARPAGREAPQAVQLAAARIDTDSPAAARDIPAVEKPRVDIRSLAQRVEAQPGRKEVLQTAAQAERESATLRTTAPRQHSDKARDTAVARAVLDVRDRAAPRAQEILRRVERRRIAVQAAPQTVRVGTADRRRAAVTPQNAGPSAPVVEDPAPVTVDGLERLQDPVGRLLKPEAIALAILRESALHARAPDPVARESRPGLPKDIAARRPPMPQRRNADVTEPGASTPEAGSPDWNPGIADPPTAEHPSPSRAVQVASLRAVPAVQGRPAALRPYAALEALVVGTTATPEAAAPLELTLKKAVRSDAPRARNDAVSVRPQGLVLPEARDPAAPIESRRLPAARPAPPAAVTAGAPLLSRPWTGMAPPDVALTAIEPSEMRLRKKTADQSGPPVSRQDAPPAPRARPLVSQSEQADTGRQVQFTWAPLLLSPDGREPGRDPIGLRRKSASQSTGRDQWRQRFPFVALADGDRSDRTAMINLAHQFETRTGSPMPYSGVEVDWTSPELARMPFLFVSGHDDFRLDSETASTLRKYLQDGGFLWINDSTDIGDETFDKAIRREIQAVLPNTKWEKIPKANALFSSPYDLRNGYRGYAVPPGDKYRVDYIEGLAVGSRYAVIYTRNDYGDGLEIDAHTHPLMASLTDLSPQEMQEGSVRMGINIVTYFLTAGESTGFRMTSAMAQRVRGSSREPVRPWEGKQQTPLPLFANATAWCPPDGWDQLMETEVSATSGGLAVVFRQPSGVPFRQRLHKAVTGCDLGLDVTRDHIVLADVDNRLAAGTRVALAFDLAGPPGYIETAPVFVRPGRNLNVAFDLGSGNLKSEETKWEYKASFPANAAVSKVYLVILPQEPRGTIRFSNFRLAR